VVVVQVYQESAVGADPLSLLPIGAGLAWVAVSHMDDFSQLVWVGVGAVTLLVAVAAAVVTTSGVVVVVLHLAVSVAVAVVASNPVEGGVIVGMGMSYSGQQWGRCGGRNTPIVVWLGRGREFGNGIVVVGEGPAFVGVDRGGSGHIANFGGQVSQGTPCGTGGGGRVSFQSCGLGTRYDRGRESRST